MKRFILPLLVCLCLAMNTRQASAQIEDIPIEASVSGKEDMVIIPFVVRRSGAFRGKYTLDATITPVLPLLPQLPKVQVIRADNPNDTLEAFAAVIDNNSVPFTISGDYRLTVRCRTAKAIDSVSIIVHFSPKILQSYETRNKVNILKEKVARSPQMGVPWRYRVPYSFISKYDTVPHDQLSILYIDKNTKDTLRFPFQEETVFPPTPAGRILIMIVRKFPYSDTVFLMCSKEIYTPLPPLEIIMNTTPKLIPNTVRLTNSGLTFRVSIDSLFVFYERCVDILKDANGNYQKIYATTGNVRLLDSAAIIVFNDIISNLRIYDADGPIPTELWTMNAETAHVTEVKYDTSKAMFSIILEISGLPFKNLPRTGDWFVRGNLVLDLPIVQLEYRTEGRASSNAKILRGGGFEGLRTEVIRQQGIFGINIPYSRKAVKR